MSDNAELLEALLETTAEIPPLTPLEVRRMRKMLDEFEKAAWLKKRIIVWAPRVAAVIGGLYAIWQWAVASLPHSGK